MDIIYNDKVIKIKKKLNLLDKLVVDFTQLLNKINITYALVAGYVSILFGRSNLQKILTSLLKN